MHPLDLIKVRFQLAGAETSRPSLAAVSSSSSSSFSTSPASINPTELSKKPGFGRAVYGALADAVKQDGWKGLYRGLVPNLVGGAGSWGLYFLL